MSKYEINEHVHRLAAWAASRAASPRKANSFKVIEGKNILEKSGMADLIGSVTKLPDPEEMDEVHKIWRKNIIHVAKENYDLTFTHGIAAKLINIYLKVVYVNLTFAYEEKVAALHPPIDRQLLNGLSEMNFNSSSKNIWKKYSKIGWTNFDSEIYEDVIKYIKEYLGPNQPLWKIEEAWEGFQKN